MGFGKHAERTRTEALEEEPGYCALADGWLAYCPKTTAIQRCFHTRHSTTTLPVHRVDAGYPKTLARKHPSLPQLPFRLSPVTEAEEWLVYAERKTWAVDFATALLADAEHPPWPSGKVDDVADAALLGWWWLGWRARGQRGGDGGRSDVTVLPQALPHARPRSQDLAHDGAAHRRRLQDRAFLRRYRARRRRRLARAPAPQAALPAREHAAAVR